MAPPPLIYLAGLGLGFALNASLPSAAVPGTATWVAGGLLSAAGLGLARGFVRALGGAKTPIDPSRQPTALVTTGPYRFTRNPGYVAMALAYSGIALLAGNLWAFASLVPVLVLIDRGVIAREERCLQRLFGKDYTQYKSRTRRWL